MPQTQSNREPQALAPTGQPNPKSLGFKLILSSFICLLILFVISVILLLVQHNRKPQVVAAVNRVTIHITSQGFQPATLVVKPDTVVVWISDDPARVHVIASNPYPSDNGLSALKSAQLGNGAQFEYTFTHAGSYAYHDDLNPATNGTITVK